MMALKNIIFVVVALTSQIYQLGFAAERIDVKLGAVENLELPSHTFVALSLTKVTNGTDYLLQLHSQIYNMTLCKSPIMTPDSCKNGTDIGMYIRSPSVVDNDTMVVWYVRMDSSNKTTVASYLKSLDGREPIPGGCNQVFNLEQDASIELSYQEHQTRMFFQWANEPVLGIEPDCDSDWVLSDLEYTFYVYFLEGKSFGEESYLEGVSKMLELEDIQHHGQKIETIQNEATFKPEIFVASEPSRGAIYTIVVSSKNSGKASAYVTAVTYSCDFVLETCDDDLTTGQIIIIIMCFLVGVYLLLLGHRMFHFSQFVFGYLLTFFLTFLLMSMAYTLHRTVVLGVAGCIAVLGGGVCLVFWYYCFFPIASVMIPGICAGYLVAATLFFTPFGRIVWWESNTNYILAFICAILVYSVLLMAFSKFLSILSSTLVGSYLVLMIVAVPLRSSLRLIYLFTEYRQTERNFEKVKPISPMTPTDIALLTMWPVLMIMGLVFQYYRERGRPSFERFDLRWKIPEIPKRRKISPNGEVDPLYETDTEATEYDSDNPSERSRVLPTPTERSPLLRSAVPPSSNQSAPIGVNAQPSYESIQDSQEVPRSMKEIC